MSERHYDLILVGSSFASSFFLLKYLEKKPKSRVLVLERGRKDPHAWRLENHKSLDSYGILSSTNYQNTYENLTPDKAWVYTPSFGGSSNCWWACTPRFMPNDFLLKSLYGVGRDWPLSYDELEDYYVQAEAVMNMSGPQGNTPYPMSKPYPQKPHIVNSAWEILQREDPDNFFPMPTARASEATNNRTACCATLSCALCPVNAKFTIENELGYLFDSEQVELLLGVTVDSLDIQGNVCRGVNYKTANQIKSARADLIVLGANPIFNSHILLNSGDEHALLGKGIVDHASLLCEIDLAGVSGMDGGSSATGHGYVWYDGEHRSERAACLIESHNTSQMRIERGKYQQRTMMKFVFEDIAQDSNAVELTKVEGKPSVSFNGYSQYLENSIDYVKENIESLLSTLPVERYLLSERPHPTEGHIMGTVIMGSDPNDSVVDRNLLHHKIKNLVVAGASSFPSVAPANPTLTLSALSLWSADNLV